MAHRRVVQMLGALCGALLLGGAAVAVDAGLTPTPAASSGPAAGAGGKTPVAKPAAAASAPAVAAGPSWMSLTPTQQQLLAPLQRDWAQIEPNRKQKWLEVAARFPTMPADERQRVQQRMVAWAKLTPGERARARLQYQEVRQVPAEERQERWRAYQALSEDERKALAQRARPAQRAASAGESAVGPRRGTDGQPLLAAHAAPGAASGAAPPSLAPGSATSSSAAVGSVAKRNIVQSPPATPVRAVAPTMVQGKPGATTTTMSTRPQPPSHNQTGLPKIAATPGYVDPATLLPRRGPQGAAVRAAASNDAATQP